MKLGNIFRDCTFQFNVTIPVNNFDYSYHVRISFHPSVDNTTKGLFEQVTVRKMDEGGYSLWPLLHLQSHFAAKRELLPIKDSTNVTE